MKYFILVSFFISLSTKATAAVYSTSGNIESKIINYTENTSSNLGYYNFFQIEQRSKLSSSFIGMNQFRFKALSLEKDLQVKKTVKKQDMFEAYLGENYIRFQSSKLIVQAGFQEVVWGESFGLNYADIINPKDNRITLYSDQGQIRTPLLLINTKLFFDFGSLQLLLSPRPDFSKTLPVDIFIADRIVQNEISISRLKSPAIFKENEYGLKLSTSFSGLDLSFFYYNYLDREPYYTVLTAGQSSISLAENHSRISTGGLSFAKTIYDFVLRSDLVLTKNKAYNYIQNSLLKDYKSDTTQVIVSLDTPTYNKYTGYLILANSAQKDYFEGSFQLQNYTYIIGRVTKSMSSEISLEASYTRELKSSGNSIQSVLSWPIGNNVEIKVGGEIYFGEPDSTFAKIKKVNNVFFSLKNFFQI